jgi:hypothetical protein
MRARLTSFDMGAFLTFVRAVEPTCHVHALKYSIVKCTHRKTHAQKGPRLNALTDLTA